HSCSTLFPYTTLFRSTSFKSLSIGSCKPLSVDSSSLVGTVIILHHIIVVGVVKSKIPKKIFLLNEVVVHAELHPFIDDIGIQVLDRKSTRLNSSHVKI